MDTIISGRQAAFISRIAILNFFDNGAGALLGTNNNKLKCNNKIKLLILHKVTAYI
jgi:hypothetical protein